MFYFILLQRANNFFLLQPSVQLQDFHAILAGGYYSAVYHSGLLLHQDTKRVAFCVVYKIKV